MDTIGRYRVIRALGHGGMGQVYLAHDPSLERDVAIKLLHRDAGSGLRDEAKALAALRHPGIVTIFEIGEHDGQDFIAMEYLPGRSLRQVILDGASRPTLLGICAKVAIAVAAAHRAGILHRDIKPENVIVGTGGEVKVIDFGLARRLQHGGPRMSRAVTARELVETLTGSLGGEHDTIVTAETQTVFGTPAYMAPEVLLGGSPGEPSDVYALGIVIHECLTGRRPHDATTLVAVIAQAIAGEYPRLDDPLGGLVERMLEREPDRRPPLEVVAALLQRDIDGVRESAPTIAPPAPARRRVAPLAVAIGAVVAAGLGVGAWAVLRGSTSAPASPAMSGPVAAKTTAGVTASIAVAPLVIEHPSYGTEPPTQATVADTLARLLTQVEGAHLTGLAIATADQAAARAVSAEYVLRGTIRAEGSTLKARVELVAVESGAVVSTVEVARPGPGLASLFDAIVDGAARALAPEAHLPAAANRMRAQVFFQAGRPVLDSGRLTDARPYLEQAVDADPSFFDGWYALALVFAWANAPEDLVAFATERALATAPAGPKKELMRGVSLFTAGKYGEARAALEPLETMSGGAQPAVRDLWYHLGEANWHDGRFDAGFAYFKRSLEADKTFRPATIHAWQYAVARRDDQPARYYIGLASEAPEWIEFALGHYADLARSGGGGHKLAAQLVLGVADSPELAAKLAGDDLEARTYRIAVAVAAGDLDTARREFAATWERHVAHADREHLPGGTYYGLEGLGEVVISAGMGPEARQLVTFLGEQAHRHGRHNVRGYARLAILTAALVGDASLVVRSELTERERTLAAATDAELAGDHATAAELRRQIVSQPSWPWDYPERAALLRDLRALHRTREAKALCADTVKPAVFRVALLPVRAACTK